MAKKLNRTGDRTENNERTIASMVATIATMNANDLRHFSDMDGSADSGEAETFANACNPERSVGASNSLASKKPRR